MAYDVELADRLRALLSPEPGVSEKRMFGGLAFLVDGHMAVAAGNHGGLLLRVDPAQRDALADDPLARPFEMRGRELAGWLHVTVDAAMSEGELRRWVGLGVVQARAQPRS